MGPLKLFLGQFLSPFFGLFWGQFFGQFWVHFGSILIDLGVHFLGHFMIHFYLLTFSLIWAVFITYSYLGYQYLIITKDLYDLQCPVFHVSNILLDDVVS